MVVLSQAWAVIGVVTVGALSIAGLSGLLFVIVRFLVKAYKSVRSSNYCFVIPEINCRVILF